MQIYSTYKITNKVNGKIYIGQTKKGILKRWQIHIRISKTPKSKCFQLLHKAIKKYGKINFIIEEIEIFNTYEEVIKSEIYWINFYKTNVKNYGSKFGYNLTAGGEGHLGIKMTDVTKNKIRLKALGRKASESTKLIFSKMRKGKGNGMYGKNHTDNSKFKIGSTRKQLGIAKGINNPKVKLTEDQVKQIKILLKQGRKQKDIAIIYGVFKTAIQKIASGKNWSHITID